MLLNAVDEKRILSQYVFNDSMFNSGFENFEIILMDNLRGLEEEYSYRYEEKEYLKDVYDRVIFFTVNQYFDPQHKIKSQYLKSGDIYMCSYIFVYFENLLKYRKSNEIKYFVQRDEEGYETYNCNEVGKVALKTYLASAICLSRAGIIADYNIENIKEKIKANHI